jgi:hypothetical protein
LGLLTIKAAIEASYALRKETRREWTNIHGNAAPIFFDRPNSSALHSVFRFDESHEPYEQVQTAEPLFNLMSLYYQIFFPRGRNIQQALQNNVIYYDEVTQEAGSRHDPLNAAIFAYMEGMLAQGDSSKADSFFDELENFLDVLGVNDDDNPWQVLKSLDKKDNVTFSSPELATSDVTYSAALVWIVLSTMGGARFAGGITDTQFVYEELRLAWARSRKMPRTWKNLRLSGLGDTHDVALVLNELTYP